MAMMTSASASASASQRLTGRHPHRFPGGGAPVAQWFPRTSNMYLSQKAIGVSFLWTDMVDLNQHLCIHSTTKKKCSLRLSLSRHNKQTLSCRWLEFKKHLPPFRKAARTVYPPLLASTDDGVTVNGSPQASSYSEMEDIRVKLNQSLQGEDVSSGLVQSIHDAARAVELAILENSSSSKASWFSKAWLGLDKNARVKTLSYQAAVYSLFQAAIEISSRGEGRDRDMNVFVQRSLSRQCAPLESTIRDELSTKQPETYEWFWSQQHPMVVTSFVNMFERDPRFSAATMPSWKGDSSGLGSESDISLLMLALSCLAAVTKLGSAKVYCSEFFSMIPDVTGRLMDMLLDYLPIQKAYYAMKDIGLYREFLLHFGPRAASGKAKNHEEIVFWVDLIQRQLQRAIDRERIWSRLTTCESIEVLEKDLAIFGFFIALGRSTKSFLSSNNLSVMDDSIESIIRYLIGGSVLYYPQLSSISSYQLYVEVVCEELEWLPFYQTKSANAKQILEENIKQEGISQQEAVLRILDVCSYWMTSFIKYSTLLENPSNIKAARFLSKGHNMLNECKKEAGVLKTGRKNNIVEYQGQQESRTKEFVESPLDSFDKALESVEGALNRLEDLLQELHLSNSNPGNEHLKAACSDLERIRKLKKEAEFLEASFRAKTALLVEEGDADEQSQSTISEQRLFSTKKAGNISKESEIDSKPLQSNKQGFWSFLVRNSTRKPDPGLSKSALNISNTIKDTLDSESNEIRRFELLRRELIELEKRVQRSTDDTQNDEDSDLIVVKQKRASTLGHLMLVPREKKDNVLAKSIDKIKETGTDVWQGTQLLAIDSVAALVLLRRALTGDELTEKEKKALRRTLTDLASVVPIGILMLLPVTAVGHAAMLAAIQRYVPSLIPSTYGPERLSLLRELEKVKEMETTEMTSDETTDDIRLTLKDSENQ